MKGVRVVDQPISLFHGETLSTTTTIKGLGLPDQVSEAVVYDGSADFRLQLGPPLDYCGKTIDNEVTFTDYTTVAKDRSTSTSVDLSALSTAAAGDYWYLASRFPFGGATIDVDGANSTDPCTMTGYYWNGSTWAAASITDGTNSGTICLAQDGNVTWTVPAAWRPKEFAAAGDRWLYVMRLQVDDDLDAATTIDEITLLPDTTANPPGYFESATVYTLSLNKDEVGSLCFYLDSGTSTQYITWAKHSYS